MLNYISIVKNADNKVSKYQDFATKSEADAHCDQYGGFVVDKPDNERTDYWIVDASKKTVTFDKSSADTDAAKIVATQYQRIRQPLYPSVGDQLDCLWKGGDARAEMKVLVDKVKTDNPKP